MMLSTGFRKCLLSLLFTLISLFSFSQTTVTDSIISGGIYRSYRLYIPAIYNGSSAHPLVINLHGYTSNATAQQAYSNFMPIADTANFLTVYPQGTVVNGQPYWNAGFYPSPPAVNDVQFISDLIDHLASKYNIDLNSVYSCGMSNGGYMSYTLACALSNRIAAIASVAGDMVNGQVSSCTPGRAVPVMQIHGTADGTVAYGGSSTSIPIDSLVKYWVTNDHCNPVPAFNNVPNINTSDGCTAEHYVYSAGDNGSTVEFYKIIGGDHSWPGSPYVVVTTNEDFNASAMIWLFFRKYKLDQFTGIAEHNKNSFNLFPNPSSSVITIQSKRFEHIIIIDINGREMISTTAKQIDVSGLSPGVYSVIIISDDSRSIQRFIKM